MESVYNLCHLLIQKGKDSEYVIEKMDVYYAAGRLSSDEYHSLLLEIEDRD